MALHKVKKLRSNAKAQIDVHTENIKKRWWFKPLQVFIYIFGICLFLFFNADDIWKGVQEYERSAKQQTTKQAVWSAMKAGVVDKAKCSFSLIKYGVGIKDDVVEAGEKLIDDSTDEIERRTK